ncbi:MAG: hypothetical protein RL199_792 [Pseudomonadota bacterium]|jgi:hypothetical protein
MKDPVALAYSGRIEEAERAARAQILADDPLARAGAWEAFAVLGREHGLKTDASLDTALADAVRTEGAVGRRALEAAMELRSTAPEAFVVERLNRGSAGWEHLRFAGERPSHGLARGLAGGWKLLDPALADEALLTAAAMPLSGPAKAEWGTRALALVAAPQASVRVAVLRCLAFWGHVPGVDACAKALDDADEAVREQAAVSLLALDGERAVTEAAERGAECVELWSRLTPAQRKAASER